MFETNSMFKKLSIGNEKLHPLTEEDIKKIQSVILEMICDIDALCKKHSLNYYLAGGTALGAVRHKGFIPWDEDADLCMPRAHYDKFISIAKDELADKYWVQSFCTRQNSDLLFLKLRKKGTRYLELFETDPECAGIFVDIYPIENIPDNALLRFFHGFICDLLFFACSCRRVHLKKQRFLEYIGDNKKAAAVIHFKAFIGLMLGFASMNKWCYIADRWAKRYSNKSSSRFITIPSGIKHYFGEINERKKIEPGKCCLFESKEFNIMAQPHYYLKNLYGDYNVIPSEYERHSVLELDFGEK